VSGLPHKGTKYRIVTVELLIPDNAEMFMDVLSNFRDDNRDELVQWGTVKRPTSALPRDAAIAEWKVRHNETIVISESE